MIQDHSKNASHKQDPLLVVMLATAIAFAVLVVGIAIFWKSAPVLIEIPWFVPMIGTFNSLTSLCVAFLALGRYRVLRDPVSFWVGIGFASLCIGQVFYVLAWPGLLPDERSLIASLANTSGFLAEINLTLLGCFLLTSVLYRSTENNVPVQGRWLRIVAAWLIPVTLTFVLFVWLEQYLPVLVRTDGTFTRLFQAWALGLLFLFLAGSFLSLRYYRRSKDALAGYVAFAQMALVFIILMAILGQKRYDLWWYTQRMILVYAYLIVLFGLLSDYVRLLRRETEGRLMLDAVMENIPIGLVITSGAPDFPLSRVSRYALELSQRPAQELLGQPAGQNQDAWKIYLPDGITRPRPEHLPLFRASQFGEKVRNVELVIEAQDGQKIPVLVNASPIRDAQGEIVAAINTWLEITEIKRAEEALAEAASKLERSNRELEQFAFVASHDLQEPLRKIEMFGELLIQSAPPFDEHQQDYVERMQKAAGRMRDMIDGLLHLSRVNTQGQPFTRVSLAQVAADVLSDLEYQIIRTGGMVVVSNLPEVLGDPLQLQQLLQNLIGNALKYHTPGTPPLIKVHASQIPAGVQILVEDNGIGFNTADVERMFQPFQRLVGRHDFEGSGMGLAICRRIVERHGGEITARSEPGKGSMFIVTLPS